MAKLPEMFEPGELDRTRKNIGPVSEAEARELAKKLGGQPGVEKTPQEIERKYQALREKTWERHAPGWVGGAAPARRRASGEEFSPPPPMKFVHRWTLDWHLTRYEYRAKSVWQALSVLWNRQGPDRPRRDWILEVDRRWFRSLENLAISVRGLTARQHKSALQSLRRIPLYYNILRVLREWDVEAISRELEALQRTPSSLTFTRLSGLTKLVMRPYYVLSELSPGGHIQPALQKMYQLARMYLVAEKDLDRLRKYYVVARDEVDLIFPGLKQHLYPVLIKLLGHEFLPQETFYEKYRSAILDFLDLPEEEILRPQESRPAEPLRRDKVPEPIEEPAPHEPDEARVVPPGRLAARGKDLLAALFPDSGLDKPPGAADDWAYFSPLFNYPRGAELIPPNDPLGRALTLALIVDQFFFGMENFRLSATFNPSGSNLSPRKQLDNLASEWRRALSEIFDRRYLVTLLDYCRTLEHAGAESANVRRLEEQLYWIRKNGVLPHERIPLLKEARAQPLGAIPLFRLVDELSQFLMALAVDTERALKAHEIERCALLNPLEIFRFDIDSPLSRRLHSHFRKAVRLDPAVDPYVDLRNNRTLLFVALATLHYLDYFLNNPNSTAYRRPPANLYRRLGGGDPRPVYSVRALDTHEILVRANQADALNQKANRGLPVEDDLNDLYGPWLFRGEIADTLKRRHEPTEGGLAALRIYLGKDIEQESLTLRLGDRLAAAFPGQSLTRQDQVYLLLFDQPQELPSDRLGAFLRDVSHSPEALPVHAVYVPFHRSLNVERLYHLAERGLSECASFPPQVLGVFDHASGTFGFVEDLPLCEISFEDQPEETPLSGDGVSQPETP